MSLAGRILLSIVAVITSISPILADYNKTHLFNPTWPPHAKFHDGMSMGFGLGLLALWLTWRPSSERVFALRAAALVDGLYSMAFIPSILLPGTAFMDPGREMPHPLGVPINFFLALSCIALVAAGYVLASRSSTQAPEQSKSETTAAP